MCPADQSCVLNDKSSLCINGGCISGGATCQSPTVMPCGRGGTTCPGGQACVLNDRSNVCGGGGCMTNGSSCQSPSVIPCGVNGGQTCSGGLVCFNNKCSGPFDIQCGQGPNNMGRFCGGRGSNSLCLNNSCKNIGSTNFGESNYRDMSTAEQRVRDYVRANALAGECDLGDPLPSKDGTTRRPVAQVANDLFYVSGKCKKRKHKTSQVRSVLLKIVFDGNGNVISMHDPDTSDRLERHDLDWYNSCSCNDCNFVNRKTGRCLPSTY